jgi:membrane protein DedA with SNARE-associated domain
VFEHLLQVAEPWLERYGYAAVFGALFLEGVGIPAPGLTFLIAAVMMASRGLMHIAPVVGLALIGILSGCQLAYVIGRAGGRRTLLRLGLVNRQRLQRLQSLFARWGPALLVVAPFLDGTRQYGSLVAGFADMGWGRFTLFNLSGVIIWIGSWSIATDVLGHHLEPVLRFADSWGPWLLAALLAVLVLLLIRELGYRRGRP